MVAFLSIGVILLAVAGVLVLADWGRFSERMPTQVPPRRVAWYPFAAGLVMIVTGLTIAASRGFD
jgi:hypothetical protein